MPGPKVSQQNIAQSITLPLPACLLPIVHPGAISSPVRLFILASFTAVFFCFQKVSDSEVLERSYGLLLELNMYFYRCSAQSLEF
ncbi:hypothetical protein PDJAM_G00080250 [Pangasius djambal]|uniref:Uncharacterized protein n=1 Tax=Pangasius djambal TaxID=1691987 RepID=A0ACC5Z4T4_9TELE|nr:hypothetical protein [Pangasius djambal]